MLCHLAFKEEITTMNLFNDYTTAFAGLVVILATVLI
jgi:hypothetical protein